MSEARGSGISDGQASRIPATVIIDTQNFYGFSGSVLGPRGKPDPVGVWQAFQYLGYELDELHIAVAQPAPDDAQEAANRLVSVRNDVQSVGADCRVAAKAFSASPQSREDVTLAAKHCDNAVNLLHGVGYPQGNKSIGEPMLNRLRSTCDDSRNQVHLAIGRLDSGLNPLWQFHNEDVPGRTVAAALVIARARQRLDRLSVRLSDIGSYLHAAASNLAYLSRLKQPTSLTFKVSPCIGRFPIGRDGVRAAEKRIDTLCAVECLEATRAAVEKGGDRAVILVSDDDDLSPALTRAASIALKSPVTVIVAGTATVANRWRGASPGQPAWLQLDASTVCRMAGVDLNEMTAQRSELAGLCLGHGIAFEVGKDTRVASAHGLEAEYEGPPLTAAPTKLFATSLDWGRSGSYTIPRVTVGVAPPRKPFGRIVAAEARADGPPRVKATEHEIPVTGEYRVTPARIGAPGWWQVGHRLVICEVMIRERTVEKVVGPQPATGQTFVDVAVGKIIEVTGEFATVQNNSGEWDVFGRGCKLTVGDRVIIWPYERTRAVQTRYRPSAVLLSSAL